MKSLTQMTIVKMQLNIIKAYLFKHEINWCFTYGSLHNEILKVTYHSCKKKKVKYHYSAGFCTLPCMKRHFNV